VSVFLKKILNRHIERLL